jgi:uncharacterized protein (DUF1015 family)
MPVEPGPASFADVPRPDGLLLHPFRALRYADHVDLSAATSPPYDVIDAAGVAALEQASDVNVVRLILPRDGHGEGDRYGRAAATLARWREEGVLTADDAPALYVYEQASATHAQRGLLGAVGLTPPEDGVVLPHENTMAGPVADRLALYEAVEADLEPVFLLYGGGGAASEAVRTADQAPPIADTTQPDGLRHRLWAVTDPAQLAEVQDDLRGRTAVIADGHHRWATYLQRQERAHAAGHGPGPWDSGLVFLVDSTAFGPEVHAIHRVLPRQDGGDLARRAAGWTAHELDGNDLAPALEALAREGADGPAFLLVSGDGGTIRLLSRPDPALLTAGLPADRSDAWRSLDVSVLHHVLVAAAWGLPDDEETVRYAHDVTEAVALAAQTDGTAVLLNPTPASTVAAVAQAGERMPRKSTLFTPKPRTGMLLRAFRDA